MSTTQALDERINKHVLGGGRGCPVCNACALQIRFFPLICYSEQIHRPLKCLSCDAEWDEVYKIAGGKLHRISGGEE